MDFRTKVELPLGQASIGHADRMMLLGSCFAENIGKRLADRKVSCDVNPFGVLYNPLSIAEALYELQEGKPYTADQLMEHQGIWFSLMHHSAFSSRSRDECLMRINGRAVYVGNSPDISMEGRWTGGRELSQVARPVFYPSVAFG